MLYQNRLITYVVVVVLQLQLSAAHSSSITFSPSTPLCIGETVQMICYVIPPTDEPFIDTVALMSFNDSGSANISTINDNSLAGIDTSRYTADTSGLGNTVSRPGIRLTITDYQASDGATNFSCYGAYSGGIPSPAIISGYPQRLAEPVSLPDTNAKISFQILNDLSISVNATLLSEIEGSDTLNYTYTLEYNTSSETSSSTQNNSYTFMTKFTCDVCYTVSYTAENCAGGSGNVSSGNFGLQRINVTTGYFTQSVSDPKQIEWRYNESLCGNNTEEDYLPDEYFEFLLVNRKTGNMSSVTNSGLNLPYGFFLDIPQNIDITSLTTNNYDLEITFIDPCFNVTIPINIAASTVNYLTIVLIVVFGLLIYFLLQVAIIVACLVKFRNEKINYDDIYSL